MGTAVDAGIEGLRTAARRAAETGAWQEAEARFRSLLAAAPDDQEALNVLGTCALMHGRLAEARWLLEQALRVDPRDGSARKNLGLLYLQLGDLDRARAVLAQAVADDPRHVVALLYLGVLEERAGRGAAIADRVLAPLRERHGAAALARVARCVDNLLGRDTTRPASPRQRPKFLYFPGLPETPFLSRDLFAWAEALQAQCERIRDEMLEVLEAPAALIPFLGTPPPGAKSSCLDATGAGPARWDGVFFHRHGRRHDDNCARCPATVAALSPTCRWWSRPAAPSASATRNMPGAPAAASASTTPSSTRPGTGATGSGSSCCSTCGTRTSSRSSARRSPPSWGRWGTPRRCRADRGVGALSRRARPAGAGARPPGAPACANRTRPGSR